MTSATRDSWERLVAAVLKREQFRQLCRQDSISTVSSEGFSERILSFSSNRLSSLFVSPSPLVPIRNPPLYQGGNTASSGPTKWKLFLAWFKREKIKEKYLVIISEDLRIHLGLLRRFSLHELQVAMENLNKSGFGDGFATIYKGQLADGSKVAVQKLLHRGVKNAAQQMLEKVEIDSFAAHPNVLNLLGFCITPKEWLLVYPLMVNGSVAMHLGGMLERHLLPINWPMRKGIALGAAKGLTHLHEECVKKILHRDIKAANIFLNEDFEAVVGDFRVGTLAEHGASDIEDELCGTYGHIAPEYLTTSKFSEKNDVFAYGVFLLELITGQKAFDLCRLANVGKATLPEWVKGKLEEKKWRMMIDADCGDYIDEEVEHMLHIALVCTHSDPGARPKMSEVVKALEVDVFAEKWVVQRSRNVHECCQSQVYLFTRPQKLA